MTSRAAGEVLLSLSGRVDCAGLSGSPPPVPCAAIIGAQEMLMKKARVNNDCFNAWLIEFLDAVLWCGYAIGWRPAFLAAVVQFSAVFPAWPDRGTDTSRQPAMPRGHYPVSGLLSSAIQAHNSPVPESQEGKPC